MKIVPNCPACGSNSVRILVVLDEERRARFDSFIDRKYGGLITNWIKDVPPVVTSCSICGHCWYRNQPEADQLNQMYAAGRPLTNGIELSRDANPRMRIEMRRLRNFVNRDVKTAHLLDFGSGLGRWSRAAVLEGFSVTAYEPSVERGSEEDTPFKLVHSIDELKNRKFDAIQLEQVLEHVPDPLATLKQLRELCKPHAVIRITVPNLLRDKDAGKVWSTWPFDEEKPHFLAPFEHLHGFTPTSLDRLLRRAGYKNINPINELRYGHLNFLRQKIGRVASRLNSTLRFVYPMV